MLSRLGIFHDFVIVLHSSIVCWDHFLHFTVHYYRHRHVLVYDGFTACFLQLFAHLIAPDSHVSLLLEVSVAYD
jgi:hypothetical protein